MYIASGVVKVYRFRCCIYWDGMTVIMGNGILLNGVVSRIADTMIGHGRTFLHHLLFLMGI